MNTSYELSRFFATASFEDKTAVLLHICEGDPTFLLSAIQAATKPTWEDEVIALLKDGKKINAIKVCRARTGWALKDAKDAVEAIQKETGLWQAALG